MITIHRNHTANLSVNIMSQEELPQLFDLFEYSDQEEMIRSNTKMIEDQIVVFFGLYSDSTLIGEVRVKFSDIDPEIASFGNRAYIYALRICSNHRNKGYATYLMQTVMSYLNSNGYSEYSIGVEDDNFPAQKLYRKLGFVQKVKRICETYQADTYEYDLFLRKRSV